MSKSIRFVLLRGWTRDHRHWHRFPEFLAHATGAEVITLDLPGVGTENARQSPATIKSITNDVARRYQQNYESNSLTFVIGISMGGMVAWDWCVKEPNTFQGAVFINSSLANRAKPWERLQFSNLPTLFKLIFSRDLEAQEKGILDLTSSQSNSEKLGLSKRFAHFAEQTPIYPRTWLKQIIAAATFRPTLSPKIPALVVTSANDKLVSPKCSEPLVELLGATHIENARAGHDLPLDDPEWLASIIHDWVRNTMHPAPASGN